MKQIEEEARKRQISLAGTRTGDLVAPMPEGERGRSRDKAGEQLGGLKQYSTVRAPVHEREKGESCDKAGELLGHYNAPQYKDNPVVAPMPELERGRSDNKAGEPLGINGGPYALPIKNKILGD